MVAAPAKGHAYAILLAVCTTASLTLADCGGHTEGNARSCESMPGMPCGDRACYPDEHCADATCGTCLPLGEDLITGCLNSPVLACGSGVCGSPFLLSNGGFIPSCCSDGRCGLSSPAGEDGSAGQCLEDLDPAVLTVPNCGSYDACVAEHSGCSQCAVCTCSRCRCFWRASRECNGPPGFCALLSEYLQSCLAKEACQCNKQ